MLRMAFSISQILLHPRSRIPFVGLWHFLCDLFYCPEPSGHGCPSARPLATSFDNPSLCFCNEKQHSSRGMTSSVSTGAGTEDTTLPKDWIAPTGCSEQNPLVVIPTLPLVRSPTEFSFTRRTTWWMPAFIPTDTPRLSTIISASIINTAQQY